MNPYMQHPLHNAVSLSAICPYLCVLILPVLHSADLAILLVVSFIPHFGGAASGNANAL